jgi:8-hydroxy-5-deazaflavin:NADPH oxidoreductase
MLSVSIFGAGNMGAAIARIAASGGAKVQVLARSLEEATSLASSVGGVAARVGDPLTGQIIVLAVPYRAVADIVAGYAEQLADKIIVDITNPVDYATFDALLVPADGSAAQQIASSVPGARVLKAFNTTFAGTLNSGQTGGMPTTVLIAGDDQPSKDELAAIVKASGLAAMDVGSLKRARELEALGFLQSTLAASGKISWTGGFVVAA